jgi:hypothetical protein
MGKVHPSVGGGPRQGRFLGPRRRVLRPLGLALLAAGAVYAALSTWVVPQHCAAKFCPGYRTPLSWSASFHIGGLPRVWQDHVLELVCGGARTCCCLLLLLLPTTTPAR